MAFLNLFIYLFVIFITILILPIYAQKSCKSAYCSNDNSLQIRFPFILKGQQDESCGYPGFNLTCSSQGLAAIDLPFSGRFFIRNISYNTQVIQLYDPDNCLPKRLNIGLNLSGSPFMAYSYRNYSLFSCPFGFNSSLSYSTIYCLRNSTNTVVAFDEYYSIIFRMGNINCTEMYTISVPSLIYNSHSDGINDMSLTWIQPQCAYCEMHGGNCVLTSVGSQDVQCLFPKHSKTGSRILGIMLIATIIPTTGWFLCVIFLKCNMIRNSQDNNNSIHIISIGSLTSSPQPSIPTVGGLDDSIIQSYPIVIIGENNLSPGLNNKTCPICLSEFLTKDTVRFIPECTHCFHSNCIDEWLRLNRSCPVCRSSPTYVDSTSFV
ncbi:RING-H2 finger protein ATL22-like [Impatiens glandulifera]|uniref:RING-H2 finger protein ATL22-like n=1 Tax=Impatiens glandulifera TaxID=253017 RepID=UPI001FB102B3|nr:RING-H2 finger protein ATL22-like [Impatiens glandulifera]